MCGVSGVQALIARTPSITQSLYTLQPVCVCSFLDLPNGFHQTWFPEWKSNNMLARQARDVPYLLARAGIPLTSHDLVLRAWHLQTSWSVWRRSEATLRLLREWLNLTSSRETALTTASDQTWLSLLAVKQSIATASSRAFGLDNDMVVGGEAGHTDPNRLKDVNALLEALEMNGRLHSMSPLKPHPN